MAKKTEPKETYSSKKSKGSAKGSTKKTTSSNTTDPKSRTLRIARNIAIVLAFCVGLFLVLMPILPQLPYYLLQLRGEQIYERQGDFWGESAVNTEGENNNDREIPEENTLVIPAVGIDVNVVEGESDDALNYGAWHRPNTSNPEVGGNMVITGHRFRYLPPSNLTFYHLDKVQEGDDIIVYWEGKEYDYVVTEIFVVEPEEVHIEADTASPRLTLYTCTPLWTAKQRLVVVAEPAVELDITEGEAVELESIEE